MFPLRLAVGENAGDRHEVYSRWDINCDIPGVHALIAATQCHQVIEQAAACAGYVARLTNTVSAAKSSKQRFTVRPMPRVR
jgi:hypothetical protein